jgi:prepilin-type N-terminal cleavage/methylation domain-containing protein
MSPNRAQRGLTLIELMMVVAIVGVTTLLVVPSMRQLIQATRVQAEVSRLVTAINLVRSEALRRNSPVSMCPSAMASMGEPICGGSYARGWIIFSNRDRDRVLDADDELIRVFEALPGNYTLTNRLGTRDARETITYLPDGSSRRNRTLLVCAPPGRVRASTSVVMNIVGRPRVARDWGTCPTS